jgi:hypothetical protein
MRLIDATNYSIKEFYGGRHPLTSSPLTLGKKKKFRSNACRISKERSRRRASEKLGYDPSRLFQMAGGGHEWTPATSIRH